MAYLIAPMFAARQHLVTTLSTVSLVLVTTLSISNFFTAVTRHVGYDYRARWAGTTVAKFITEMRTLASSLSATFLTT